MVKLGLITVGGDGSCLETTMVTVALRILVTELEVGAATSQRVHRLRSRP